MWDVNGELVFIPDLPVFPLSDRKKEHEFLHFDTLNK